MNQHQSQNRDLSMIAWGAIFIWWGITELIPSLPEGVGALGIGAILLGVNLIRFRRRIPISSFSTGIGILTFMLGGLELTGAVLHLPFELPIFAILLIVLGGFFLTREWIQVHAG